MKQKILITHRLQLMCQPHKPKKCQEIADLKRIISEYRNKRVIITHYNNAKHQYGAPLSTFQLFQLLIEIRYLMNALTTAGQ